MPASVRRVSEHDDGVRPSPDWAGYYRWIEGREPRPLFQRALAAYGAVPPGAVAVDLGCGDGIETQVLLAAGFAVTAIDSAARSMELLRKIPDTGSSLVLQQSSMEEADLPEADLVYAGFALPFCRPEAFDDLWARIRASLRPGGVLACDLFGERDTWADNPEMSFVTRDRATRLLEGLEVIELGESEEDGYSFSGPKHWHTLSVIARRV